jgi:dihydrofolate reductase
MKQEISLVVALNHERVIGSNNQLPWSIPEDLAYFKQVTLGKPIIMGRKTFESIGRVLPGRKNIVISRSNFQHQGVTVYSTIEDALTANSEAGEQCIIGGGEIFKQTLQYATMLNLTYVDFPVAEPCAWFPEVDLANWELAMQRDFISQSGINCSIRKYIKSR